MCERFFVVSIDDVMPRIIFEDADEQVCHVEADRHWAEDAARDERVLVTCNHDKVIAAVRATPAC